MQSTLKIVQFWELAVKIFCVILCDNDSYAFTNPRWEKSAPISRDNSSDASSTERPVERRCEVCSALKDKWNEYLRGLIVKRRKFDVSCTYDGVTTVSTRFKAAYESAVLYGLRYRRLPDDPEFFTIRPERAVAFDAERRHTRFLDRCSACGEFNSVAGAFPVFLKPGTEVGDREFVRTDVEFGSNDEKTPLILCGGAAADALKAARLKELDLGAVRD